MAIVTSFCSEHHRKNGGGLFNVLMRVNGEDGEQLDETTKMVEIGNSIEYPVIRFILSLFESKNAIF